MKGVRNLFGRFLSILSAKVLTTIVAVLSTPIIVRLLGPGGYGDYAVLLSIFSLYMIPVSGGITEGVQKFVAETRDRADWREQVVRFYATLAVLVGVVAVAVLLSFTGLGGASWLFGAEFTTYFYLLAGFVLVAQCRALVIHTVLGFGLEHITGPLKVAKKFVTVALGIGLLVVGLGVQGMLVGHIAANLLVAVVGGAVVLRRLSLSSMLGRPASFPYRELLSFNGLNIVLVLLVMSLYHVDVVMLRALVGSESTGFYKAALALAEYLWIVPIVLQTVLLHSASALWSDDRTDRLTRLSSRITRYTVLIVVVMAIGLGTLADRFVPLYYGPEFLVATTPLLLLLPGAVGFAVARPLQAICQASGRMEVLIRAVGAAAALNLALNAVLIPAFGMAGAAVATSIGYGSMFVLMVRAARKLGYDPLDDFRLGRIAVTAGVAAPVVLLVDRSIQSDILALVVVPPVGAAVYGAVAVATGAVDWSEIVAILRKVPGPVGTAIESGLSWVQ